jgi:1,4-dihydroxy-2-naphthoyl-CoA hydrolase
MDMNQVVTGLDGLLGVELAEASADRVHLRVPVTSAVHQMFGIVHGGLYCTLVESAASVGAALWLGAEGRVVGVANQTDFFKAVRDGELHAVSTPVHRGFSQQLWQVNITDGNDQLIARGQVRLQNLRPDGGRPR